MKRVSFFLLLIILISGLIFAQTAKKYRVILDDSEKIIYLDTKNIRQIDNKISVWSMIVYKQMTQTDEMGRRIGKVKTQYLINRYTKKYSIIGTLVYDEIGRMIKNNSNVNVTDNQPTQFSEDVAGNVEVSVVFDKALEFLEKGNLGETEVTDIPAPEIVAVPVEDVEMETDVESDAGKKEVAIPSEMGKRKPDQPVVFRSDKNDVASDEGEEEPVIEAAQPMVEKQTYNPANEKIVHGVIFTDGNQFVIQKASFKEKSRADNEVSRLKRLGENAFVTKAVIPAKGTWYRVRVGYFKNLQEAENYIRRN